MLEASLTGEREPVLKNAATLLQPAALGDRLNMVFQGMAVAQGSGVPWFSALRKGVLRAFVNGRQSVKSL